MSEGSQRNTTFDGVRLAVIMNRFEGVVRSMINTLVRTGRSGVLNTGRDFSCCVLTRDSELLVMAESLPIHVMSGPDLMARTMKAFHPILRKGDAFLHNSPYHGNSHAADHSILIPVVDGDGTHQFTVLAKAHQADCGNSVPTTYSAAARDVYEEGALIFPCVKVQENYSDCEDIIRICRMRIRVPDQWWGDYLALLGAARIGERGLLELGEEVGWETLKECPGDWFDYSEKRMISAIRKLPRGRVTATSAHDPFPGVPDGIPIEVTVEVKPAEAVIEIDLRNNPDCQPCGLNLTEATSRTAAIIGVLNSIDHTVPANAGSLRRLRIHLRENCVVGIPRHPASCSVATTNLSDRVTNPVQRAMAELGDGIGMAEAGLSQPPAFAVISGNDKRAEDAPFVNQLLLPGMTGGAGGPHTDGWLTLGHAGTSGMSYRDSVELDELRFPIRIIDQRIIVDSEGAGRRRGTPGAYCEFASLQDSLEVMYASDGCINPALGARGGLAGARARQYKRTSSGAITELDPCGHLVLTHGESVISMSCGGGGYGNPFEREPDRVRHDVVEGWISRERAEQIYGVRLHSDGRIDHESTSRLRQQRGIDTGLVQ